MPTAGKLTDFSEQDKFPVGHGTIYEDGIEALIANPYNNYAITYAFLWISAGACRAVNPP